MFNSSMVYYGSIVQVLVPFIDERTCLAADARYIQRWVKLGRLTRKTFTACDDLNPRCDSSY